MEILLKYLLFEAILALMASEVLQQKLATYKQPSSAHNYYRVSYYHTQCNCFKEKQTVKKKILLYLLIGQTTYLLNSVPSAEHTNVSGRILIAALRGKHYFSPLHQQH